MKCPNCEYEFMPMGDYICPNCNIDAKLYDKTVKVSDILYNKGLMKAKVSDMRGSIDCLLKSIEFNKNNITARNLLGLVYYEIGYLGDALKQWVISSSLLKENNPATAYLEQVQKNGRALERQNEAITMYNQALVYLKQKSDDLAIIQLKKAAELSPRFVDALNLLALCYLIQRDKPKALSVVERALAVDANNPVALNYYNEILPSKVRPDANTRVQSLQSQNTAPTPQFNSIKKSPISTFHLMEVLCFVIGVLCTVAMFYILIMPSEKNANEKIIMELNEKLDTKDKAYMDLKTETDAQKKADGEKVTELEQRSKELETRIKQQDVEQKLRMARILLDNNKYNECLEELATIDTTDLPSDVTQQIYVLKESAIPDALKYYYDLGMKRYEEKNFDEARINLEKAAAYASNDESKADDILYYLGMIAENNRDVVAAREYYQKIVDDYPNSNQLAKTKKRLKDLDQTS